MTTTRPIPGHHLVADRPEFLRQLAGNQPVSPTRMQGLFAPRQRHVEFHAYSPFPGRLSKFQSSARTCMTQKVRVLQRHCSLCKGTSVNPCSPCRSSQYAGFHTVGSNVVWLFQSHSGLRSVDRSSIVRKHIISQVLPLPNKYHSHQNVMNLIHNVSGSKLH